jgi:phosphonate transport system permease protein
MEGLVTREEFIQAQKKLPDLFRLTQKEKFTRLALFLGFLSILFFTLWRLGFSPIRILKGLKDLGWLIPVMFPPTSGGFLFEFIGGLGETLAMAFLGTVFGFLFAVPLGFLAAKNVIDNPVIHFLLRRFFDAIRGIDGLIWALMCVHVVGLGPFAGILAITITDTATLGKLFSEAIENIDQVQVTGTESTGANKIQLIRYAFVPQVLPVMMSNVLYFFESNVRSASILGVLGAGGIGMQLSDRIRAMRWNEACFIIIMILITVAIIDTISKSLRLRIIANEEYRP